MTSFLHIYPLIVHKNQPFRQSIHPFCSSAKPCRVCLSAALQAASVVFLQLSNDCICLRVTPLPAAVAASLACHKVASNKKKGRHESLAPTSQRIMLTNVVLSTIASAADCHLHDTQATSQ